MQTDRIELNQKCKIGRLELIAVVYNSVIHRLFIGYPEKTIKYAGSAGWISTLLSGVLFLILLKFALKIYFSHTCAANKINNYKNKKLAIIKNSLAIIYLAFLTVCTLFSASEKLKSVCYFTSPDGIIIIFLCIVAGFIAFYGYKAVFRLYSLSIIPIICTIFFIFGLNIRHGDIYHFLPILGNGGSSILKGMIINLSEYLGIGLVFFIKLYVYNHKYVENKYINNNSDDKNSNAPNEKLIQYYSKIIINTAKAAVATNVICILILSWNFSPKLAETAIPIMGFLAISGTIGNLSAHSDLLYQGAIVTSVILHLSLLLKVLFTCMKNILNPLKKFLYIKGSENITKENIDCDYVSDFDIASKKDVKNKRLNIRSSFKKLCFLFFILCAIILFACGCSDSSEVEHNAYVTAIGIDVKNNEYPQDSNIDNEIKNNDIIFTFQISNPLDLGSNLSTENNINVDDSYNKSDSDSENKSKDISKTENENSEPGLNNSNRNSNNKKIENKTVDNITVTAKSFKEATDKLQSLISKNINLSHMKLAVFSYDSAKSDKMLNICKTLFNDIEVRPSLKLCLNKNSREYLTNMHPTLEKNTVSYIELFFGNPKVPYAPIVTLSEYLDKSEDSFCDAVIPTVNQTGLWGMGVFSKGRLIYVEDGTVAGVYKIINGNQYGLCVGENKDITVSCTKPAKISIDFKDNEEEKDINNLSVKLLIKLKINPNTSEAKTTQNKNFKYEKEAKAKAEVKKMILDMLNRAQENGCDITGVSKRLKCRYLTSDGLNKSEIIQNIKNHNTKINFSIVFE